MIAEQMASKLRDAASSVLEMMFLAPVLADQELQPADAAGPILVALEFEGQFALAARAGTAQRQQPVIEVPGELANRRWGRTRTKEVPLAALDPDGQACQRTVHLESGALSMQVAVHGQAPKE